LTAENVAFQVLYGVLFQNIERSVNYKSGDWDFWYGNCHLPSCSIATAEYIKMIEIVGVKTHKSQFKDP